MIQQPVHYKYPEFPHQIRLIVTIHLHNCWKWRLTPITLINPKPLMFRSKTFDANTYTKISDCIGLPRNPSTSLYFTLFLFRSSSKSQKVEKAKTFKIHEHKPPNKLRKTTYQLNRFFQRRYKRCMNILDKCGTFCLIWSWSLAVGRWKRLNITHKWKIIKTNFVQIEEAYFFH